MTREVIFGAKLYKKRTAPANTGVFVSFDVFRPAARFTTVYRRRALAHWLVATGRGSVALLRLLTALGSQSLRVVSHDTAERGSARLSCTLGCEAARRHQGSAASAANQAQDLLAIHARLFERAIELAFG